MENLTTAGLLFNDTMVMIAGGGDVAQPERQETTVARDGEFSTSPSPSGYSSSNSSSCSPYYSNQIPLPSELFQEFNEFSAFELPTGESGTFLPGSSDEERNYMEELISSDLSSDEDKFLETIRYGGGGVVHFSNDMLSEEELVNTIQTYGDVKVVQVDGGEVAGEGERVFEIQGEEKPKGGKKRKGSVGAVAGKGVKRTLIIQQQQPPQVSPAPQKKHKQSTAARVFEEEIIIEEHGISAELLDSPSPGSPQQQTHENGSFQELKLSDEEKRLLMKEGISLPTHYPLTKLEERELKRIRRKIRNKISAQDSRKRKKEFLDRLQQKLQEVEDEKNSLQKRVRSLESINTKLNAQVKRLQQALASATSSVQGSAPPQPKNTVVPAATTLLVLILSLALVVLPTSMENGKMGGGESANEIISLLNRSNEMGAGGARVLGGSPEGSKKLHPKSRTMVGEDEELDEDDIMDVKALIGQMRSLLRNKRKRPEEERGGGMKRGRFDGGGGGLSGLIGVMKRGIREQENGWWVSDEEEEDTVKIVKGGRFGGHTSFQVLDDVEVD